MTAADRLERVIQRLWDRVSDGYLSKESATQIEAELRGKPWVAALVEAVTEDGGAP